MKNNKHLQPLTPAALYARLDAPYFHLYGLSREDVDYVMDTFPIVRRGDEARFGR